METNEEGNLSQQRKDDLWTLRWKAYDYAFSETVERLAHRVKVDLKLVSNGYGYRSATVLKEKESPLFAHHALIKGNSYMLIDDGAPGLGCFATEGQRLVEFIPYSRLACCQKLAVEVFGELSQQPAHGPSDYTEPDEGDFEPLSITIFDQFKTPIAEYRNGKWLSETDLPGEDEVECCLTEVSSLRSEAAFEGGWDNFSTARRLRSQADMLATKVAIAQRLSRVVR